LGGKDDIALIEHLIEFDEIFNDFSFEGVPDIRVIVYRGYPVMSMMRLSTSQSDGKANLHQGAVGVGIDITTGKAISAVQFNRTVKVHPDTQKELMLLEVPYWNEILTLATRAYDITKLGYLGADIVLDKTHGPMLLELNARPGLAIQIANGSGLLNRFKIIDKIDIEKSTPERVAFVLENFQDFKNSL
jgi:alpha-L-glutamate ligase-like protein